MDSKLAPADQIAAGIAANAKGVVTNDELRAAGLSRTEIHSRIERGSLLPVFRGVYRVGHKAPNIEATYMAAVKACGKDATLSGEAAGHHLGLTRGAPPPPEVTAPTNRRIKGIKTHRIELHDDETTTIRGIPTTTPARTLVDLAAVLEPQALARAAHEAQVRHRTTPAQVESILSRRCATPGCAKLRRVLNGETPTTLSHLEERFVALMKKHKLPIPQTNRPKGNHLVDCRWPEHKLTVELDSYGFHNTRHSWEQDHHREREAYARGDQFRRYTYGDVCERPRLMLRELRALLA